MAELALPEIAESITRRFGGDLETLHRTIRAFRDRGLVDAVRFKGRKALYDEVAVGKILIALALSEHGFEGIALQKLLRLADNHNAPVVPDTVQRAGFGHVMDGIERGEHWTFRFSTNRLKSYWGGCHLAGGDGYSALDDPELPKSIGGWVLTQLDLNALVRQFRGE